ncbi:MULTISPECIES: hypothetical protein [Bacillaceae]|uniref:hypothetical protein n=1 Tax=Bacillaceae TaxID=186817 RepID=UPI002FFE40E7
MKNLLKSIFEVTLDMKQALHEEEYEEYLSLLDQRAKLMSLVDEHKADHPEHSYDEQEKELLKEAQQLDEELNNELKQNLNKTAIELKQMKQTKQVSLKYQPYSKQTNGIFIDSKK